MRKIAVCKPKICLICGQEYQPASGRQKYCHKCGTEVRRRYKWSGLAQYLIDNKDLLQQRERERNQKPERKEYLRAWRIDHKEQNRESMNASGRKWVKNHPEKARLKNEKRRARILNGVIDGDALTLEQWNDTIEYFDHRCAYCGRQLEKLTIDHIVPLSRGGAHTKENVVPACRSCNSSKHNSSLLVYLLRRD